MKLIDALLPGTRQKVLALLLTHPGEEYHFREVVRQVGVKQGAVQRELATLTSVGILSKRRQANLTLYQANESCPVYQELRGLLVKTLGLADVLREVLLPLGAKVQVAFVYGSFAKGEETPGSDVDLMVIGDAAFGEVVDAVAPAEGRLGREVNPIVHSVREFGQRCREGQHFLNTVLGEEKLFVIGGSDELERLAQERLGGSAS
jgi:DNA-binding transcriptional ArsR family regulator